MAILSEGKQGVDPSAYAKVECADCSNEQIIFVRAATAVKCQVCGSGLAEPTGGVAALRGTLKEYID